MKKSLTYFMLIATICFAIISTNSSCKKDEVVNVIPTLYDSLGGATKVADPANPGQMIEKGRLGIRSVVDSTVFVIAGDNQLNGFFSVLLAEVGSGNLSGFQALSKSFTDFCCVATGAKNFTYTGRNMVAAHDPAQNNRMNGKANNANFDRFIADFVIGAQKNGLPTDLIQRVGRVLETTRSQVVQR